MTNDETRWGIGQYIDAQGRRSPWTVSNQEIERDIGSASRALKRLGITAGQRVLWCSMLSEAAQFWPLIVSTMVAGAQLSCADATEAEAPRVRMFCRELEYRAVLGVNGPILDGLDELGLGYPAVFGRIPILGARPDAYARLEASGLTPHHFVLAGPVVAIGDAPGAPAAIDATGWALSDTDGRVAVTNLTERATAFVQTPTNVTATAITNTSFVPYPGA